MADGNRHPSERRADAAGDEGVPLRDNRSALQRILDAEPPEGNWKIVGSNKISKKKGAYRVNGDCDKLPNFNVTEDPSDPRKMNLQPDCHRLVPLWVKDQREIKDIKVVSMLALKEGVTADKLYKAVNDVFRRKMQDEGLTIYRTYPPVNMAYIQFKTEADRITFVKKYNYSDVCAPTGFHPDDTYALKISYAFYKETQYFLAPPICVINVAETLMDLHGQLPYHESFPLPVMYYEFVKQQEAHKHYKRPQTPPSPPPTSSEMSIEEDRRHEQDRHRYERRSRSPNERRSRSHNDHRSRSRNHRRRDSPERDRRRHRSSSDDSSRSRRRYHRPSSRSRRYSPRHHRDRRDRHSRSPIRRPSRHEDPPVQDNPDHQLPIGERLKRIVARQDTSSHDHLKPVFSSIPPDLSKPAPKPIPLRDIWNNGFSNYEPTPVTRQPKEAPEHIAPFDPKAVYYYSVLSSAMDALTERIRKSAENSFKAAIYNKARSASLAAFEKERQELIKNPPPEPTPKPKAVKTVIPLTTKKLSEIGPIPKISDAPRRLSELGRIPKKKVLSPPRTPSVMPSSSRRATSAEREDSVMTTPRREKEHSSKKDKHGKEGTSKKDRHESSSKKDRHDKDSVSKKDRHHKGDTPRSVQPEEEVISKKDKRDKDDASKKDKHDKESSSKKDKHGKDKKDKRDKESSKKDKLEKESSKNDKPDEESASTKDKLKDKKKKKPKTIPSPTPTPDAPPVPASASVSKDNLVSDAESTGPTKIVSSDSEDNEDSGRDVAMKNIRIKLDKLRRKILKKETHLKTEKNKAFRKALHKKIEALQAETEKEKKALQNLERPRRIKPLSSDSSEEEDLLVAVDRLAAEEAAQIAAAEREFEEAERRRRESEDRRRKDAEEAARKQKEERRRKKREEEERKRKLLELREKKREEARKKAEADALAKKKREEAAKNKKKRTPKKKSKESSESSSSDSSDDEASVKKEGASDSENMPVPEPPRRRKSTYRSRSASASSSTSISSDTSFALSYGGGGIGGTDYSSDSDYEPFRRPTKSESTTGGRKRGATEGCSSGPSAKKAKVEEEDEPKPSTSAPKPKPDVPEIWDYNFEDTFYHYNLGIDDLKPYVRPTGSMLKPKFWKRREPPDDEVLPRDFFVIPDPIPKPGTGARIRYTKRTPLEEYLTTMQICKEPLDEEEIMYMEMATARTKALGELPFKFAIEWRNPAYEPDPEQFPEPIEKNHILEHYVDPSLTLLAPIREGAIRCTGLVRYSRLEKVAIRRLIVKPRLTITDDDRQMVKNIQEEYRTENTLLRKLKTAGLGDCSFLTSNALTSRPTCVTFAPSRIHDWGLYTLEDIKPKSMIIEYIGEVCRSTVVDFREQRYIENGIGSSYLFRINDDWVIDATRMGNCARFINHSCTPNSYARVVKNKHIAIYSKRFIEAGEEITYDYKFPLEDKKIPCFCNAHNCRGSLN
uniref:[histone H3]-lysine(4) N-trimethyltransferase n=1 Tax=Panagrellus redivivus TaxID=6233 RepID=A0A7E4W9C1_PANRE